MNVVKIEKIELSEKEDKAIDLVLAVCNGIQQECRNPTVKRLSENVEFALRNLYTAIKSVEE